MRSFRLQIIEWFSRSFLKRWLASVKEIDDLRSGFEQHARRSHFSPPFSVFRNGSLGGVPVKWVSRGPVDCEDILFYIHGGGFVAGSPDTHKHLVAYMAGKLAIEAVMPRYRLAPENPYPAGIDDLTASYLALVASGRRPNQIILAGDSAGGGLMFSLMAYICAQDLPRPKGCIAFSPAVDFTRSGDSMVQNVDRDAILVAKRFDEMGAMYLNGVDPKQSMVSPLFADFPNCPPVLLHVADHEILRDDTLRMQNHLIAQGADVLVRSWPTGLHVWHIMLGYFPEARAALDDVVDFVKTLKAQELGDS